MIVRPDIVIAIDFQSTLATFQDCARSGKFWDGQTVDQQPISGELRTLTSLRGLAAISVVLFHYAIAADWMSQVPLITPVPHGYIAVDLFFILSGFIMAHTYQDVFEARKWAFLPAFFIKRVARIVPLNTAIVLVLVGANLVYQTTAETTILVRSDQPLRDGILNILLLPGFGIGVNLNGPSWTISNEFAAYLCFPAILILLGGRSPRVEMLVFGTGLAGLAVLAAPNPHLGLFIVAFPKALILCLIEFTLGILSFKLLRRAHIRQVLRSDRAGAVVIAAIGILVLLRIDLLTVFAFPALIMMLTVNQGMIGRIAGTQILFFVGEISFSIYLLHIPLRPLWFGLIDRMWGYPIPFWGGELAILLTTLMVIPIAYATYVTIERPGRRFIRDLANRANNMRISNITASRMG